MPVKKKIAIWAPFRGNVGTKQAAINYAFICQKLGLEVVFIELCDEWSGLAEVADNFPIISLTNSRWLKNFGKSNIFHRRDFFLLSWVKGGALRRALSRIKPDIVISMLCTVPLIRAAQVLDIKVIASVQGFPRFLDETPSSNLYYRLEDKLRMQLWRKYYDYPEALLTMTPNTAERLSDHLELECIFCPNPLFRRLSHRSELTSVLSSPLDFVAIGRFSQQKRLDLVVRFFEQAQRSFPDARLHFFGDVSREDMRRDLTKIDTKAASQVEFHGFQQGLWNKIVNELNPVHIVASAWEDPGHAILEGLNFGVPSVFVNPRANYISFYRQLPISECDIMGHPQDTFVKRAIEGAFKSDLRHHLRDDIVRQFSFIEVEKNLAKVLGV